VNVPGGRKIETDKYSIEPGQSQAVKVTIPTRYIRTRDPYEKNDIMIETNDPDNTLIRLTMRLQVVDVLSISPYTINFGTVKARSETTREIAITNRTKDSISLTKITPAPDTVLSVSHKGGITLKPSETIKVAVTFKPSFPQKRFLGLVQVETSIENLKVKTVQARASVEGG